MEKKTFHYSENDYIHVLGARVHNLKNIDVSIPRNKITVITGLSGSGKSSLAFDTIYAEGQRRYIETFSAYARQFLGTLERPDVDKITGLSPVISIEQKTTNKNPRSTVGTTTEIYDFLRLLFARVGTAYSFHTNEKMIKYTNHEIINKIYQEFENKKIIILSPVIKSRKGHYKDLFEQISKKGFPQVRVNEKIKEIVPNLKLDRYKTHDIEIVIDKLKINQKNEERLKKSIDLAIKHGKGICMLFDVENNQIKYFSKNLMCPTTAIAYDDPAPNNFSFNSPKGACPTCKGLAKTSDIDINKIIPNPNISIEKGGIVPLGKDKKTAIFRQIDSLSKEYNFSLKTAIKNLDEKIIDIILYGCDDKLQMERNVLGVNSGYFFNYRGIIYYIQRYQQADSIKHQKWASEFISEKVCPDCNGGRLKKESLSFRILDKNISQISEMDIDELSTFFKDIESKLSEKENKIAKEILKEIRTRINFLLDVGLNYLSLNRISRSLSGGESQRIRLATQIGSQLVNVLYILDEPSIGLHQRDNEKLISSLQKLRDAENSIIIVEHDKDTILASDFVIDVGPFAGVNGGKIVGQGTVKEILKLDTLTAQYLNGKKNIEIPQKRRNGNGKFLILKGAKGNNLKNLKVKFPLGKLIGITGVSGSGKSTLINETLYPILSQKFYRSLSDPLAYESLEGIENINKVIEVNQSPIGRTPRSNPATYTGLFTEIRNLFATLTDAKIKGYKAGRFSFNVTGGRCETCKGAGVKTIEMNLLPNVYVKCDDCNGKRYNKETLELRYKGKSINDILNLTINQAIKVFQNIPKISQKLKAIQEVGLGYLKLGQSSLTLSGGEAQRIKLATELSKKDTGKTLYIFDEPTTGLHFEDIKILLSVLNTLVDKGNTIIIIEHNLDVIKTMDYIIDLGKEGGKNGGQIICQGTPEEIILNKESYTAKFLKKM